MNNQTMLAGLRTIEVDRKALEGKLVQLLKEQGISELDAPYGVASALTRLEDVETDLQNAMSELSGE